MRSFPYIRSFHFIHFFPLVNLFHRSFSTDAPLRRKKRFETGMTAPLSVKIRHKVSEIVLRPAVSGAAGSAFENCQANCVFRHVDRAEIWRI